MNAPTFHDIRNTDEAQFLAPETHPRAAEEDPDARTRQPT